MPAALGAAAVSGSAGAAAGLAALAASLLPPGRPAGKGSSAAPQRRPAARSQPQRRRAAPGVSAGSEMRGKEEKSSLKGGFGRSAGGTGCPRRRRAPHGGGITPPPPSSGTTAGCSQGSLRHGEGPGDSGRGQRSPCKNERCNAEAAEGPRSGCAAGVRGAARRGGKRAAARGGAGEAVPQPARGLGDGCLCARPACVGRGAAPAARLPGATSLGAGGDARAAASGGTGAPAALKPVRLE